MSNGIRRRQSIFSGLLLIAVGALFLYHYYARPLPIWAVISRWWPVILILWGVAKLYDHWAAQQSGQKPPRTITGGEIFLVLFLFAMAGMAGGFDYCRRNPDRCSIDDSSIFGGTHFSYSEELPAKAARANAEVRINTDRGDISVTGTDAAEIQVSVKKTASAWEENEAKARAESVKVAIAETDTGYEIRPEVDSDIQRGVIVDLDVRVPKNARIRAKGGRGDVIIRGVAGPLVVEAAGDVELAEIAGDATVTLRRGDVRVTDAKGNVSISGRGGEIEVADVSGQAVIDGEYFGPINVSKVAKGARFVSKRTDLTISQLDGRFETGSGRLEISNAPGSVQLETKDYDIVLENVGGRIQVRNRNGNVEVRLAQSPREGIQLTTERGSIDMSLPPRSSFELSAEAKRGDIDSDQELGLPSSSPDSRGDSRLTATKGSRGPQIQLRTSFGSIQLRRSE